MFELIAAKFSTGISVELIKRAFNKKSPAGASKELRDLLCYYATRGKRNWNQVISDSYPQHIDHIDIPKPNIGNKKKITLNDIWEKLLEIEGKII